MRLTTCSNQKLHQETLKIERSLMLTMIMVITQTTKCLTFSIPLRVTMELVQFYIVSLLLVFTLHMWRHHFQARSLYTNLLPKVLRFPRRFPGPLTLKLSCTVRQTMPPLCSSHNNSFSCSPKSMISTPWYSHFRGNLIMQSTIM